MGKDNLEAWGALASGICLLKTSFFKLSFTKYVPPLVHPLILQPRRAKASISFKSTIFP